MSEQFQNGQLVAVRDSEDESWCLVKYDHYDGRKHIVKRIAGAILIASEDRYRNCVPAEEIWPELFFDRESETMNYMRRMRRDLGVMRRQVRWLSEQLDQINRGRDEMCDCPDPELRFSMRPMDCDPEGCAHCWEKASLKAVENSTCPQ